MLVSFINGFQKKLPFILFLVVFHVQLFHKVDCVVSENASEDAHDGDENIDRADENDEENVEENEEANHEHEENEEEGFEESKELANKYLKLIIFDTDKTIWPFSTKYENIVPPLTKEQGDLIIDHKGNHLKPYPQTTKLFEKIHRKGIKIGIIAQSPICKTINTLLDMFEFGKYVKYRACFVGPKMDLVRKIQQISNIDFNQILLLDDEYDEAPDVMEYNATALLCEDEGAQWYDVERGLELFELDAKYVPEAST